MNEPTKIYTVSQHTVGDRPCISWLTVGEDHPVTRLDMLAVFEQWVRDHGPSNPGQILGADRHRPPTLFFQAKGAYVARAARMLGASALIVLDNNYRDVRWRFLIREKPVGGFESFLFCSIWAEIESKHVKVSACTPDGVEVTYRFEREHALEAEKGPAQGACLVNPEPPVAKKRAPMRLDLDAAERVFAAEHDMLEASTDDIRAAILRAGRHGDE